MAPTEKESPMPATTCTVRNASGVCGKPAVHSFTGQDGEAFGECAEHQITPRVSVTSPLRETIDGSYRVGRCNHCPRRPAYAWPASSGLRLEDVACPRCFKLLDRTSREARNMRRLTEHEVAWELLGAVDRAARSLGDALTGQQAWREDREMAEALGDESKALSASYNEDAYGRQVAAAEARLARLEKAQARS